MSVLTDTQAALPTGTWNLDPVHSSIGFEIPYLAGTFRGQFADVEAKVTEEGLTGSARVASIDAERHPELTFESRELERSAEALTVRGDITIRGVTGPVELTGTISEPLTDYADRQRFGLKLEATVDRTEFGLNWNAPLPSGEPALPNDVKLIAELYFVREA